jgi:glycosyltransferase 2 family protein
MRLPSPARLARIAVAAGLTLFVLWKSNPAQVLQAGRGADVRWLAAAATLVVLDRALMAFRWVVLLRALEPGTRPPLWPIVRIFFVSTFVGTFLPSVGGDVVRAWSLARLKVDAAQSAASVLMDRVLGILSLLLLGLFSLGLAGRTFASGSVLLSLAVAGAFCAAAAAVVFSARAARPILALIRFVPGRRAQEIGARLVDAVRRYARHHADLAQVLFYSVLVQILRVIQAVCLGAAIHVAATPTDYFVFIPLILLIMLVPITVNGLGTSQVAFVWFFGQVGVAAPDAFALSVLFVALGIVGNLPGGLLYGMNWRRADASAAPPPPRV